MPKLKSKVWCGIISALFVIALVVFILTFSIGLPIYFRPFYYMQIESLGVEELILEYSDWYDLGYTDESINKEVIKDAYDEVLDFLTLGKKFGTGIFKYSEEGKSHFVDCKVLFDLNAAALLISLAAVITVLILSKKNIIRLAEPFGFNMFFFAGIGMLGVFTIVGIAAAIDFEAAFTVFHMILFPGKDNWYFDPRYDEMILLLPEEFFMACGALILISIVLLTTASIIYGIKKRHRRSLDTPTCVGNES